MPAVASTNCDRVGRHSASMRRFSCASRPTGAGGSRFTVDCIQDLYIRGLSGAPRSVCSRGCRAAVHYSRGPERSPVRARAVLARYRTVPVDGGYARVLGGSSAGRSARYFAHRFIRLHLIHSGADGGAGDTWRTDPHHLHRRHVPLSLLRSCERHQSCDPPRYGAPLPGGDCSDLDGFSGKK